MHLLAIDYGLRKTGVAFFDGNLIEPLEVIEETDHKVSANRLSQLCLSLQAKQIILGLPESGPLLEKIRVFGELLGELTGLKVIYHPETLTTQAAIDRIKLVRGRKISPKKEDAVAAALLLEDYVELNHLR